MSISFLKRQNIHTVGPRRNPLEDLSVYVIPHQVAQVVQAPAPVSRVHLLHIQESNMYPPAMSHTSHPPVLVPVVHQITHHFSAFHLHTFPHHPHLPHPHVAAQYFFGPPQHQMIILGQALVTAAQFQKDLC